MLWLAAPPPAVVASAGAAYDRRCQYCGTGPEANGKDIDSHMLSMFGAWQEGAIRLSLGVRLESVEGYQSVGTRTPATLEHAFSAIVSYDPGPFAFGLGLQHQRESILIWDAQLGLPAIVLRAGYERALSAYLTFGEFGSYNESAGTVQMGISVVLPLEVRLHGGLSAELAPAIAYELGVEIPVGLGWGIAARGSVSAPDTTEFRSVGLGFHWTGDIADGPHLLTPAGD